MGMWDQTVRCPFTEADIQLPSLSDGVAAGTIKVAGSVSKVVTTQDPPAIQTMQTPPTSDSIVDASNSNDTGNVHGYSQKPRQSFAFSFKPLQLGI